MSNNFPQNKNCLIYTRVSTEEQAEEGQSLEAQERICRDYAKNNGFNVIETYSDPGRSGSDSNRPGLRALIDRCKEDTVIEAIVTQDMDRLARDTLLFLSVFKDFQEGGVSLRFVNQPNVDGSIDGMLVGTIQAAVSTFAAKQTGRKAKSTMLEKAKMGWYPSWATIGYLNVENPNPTGRFDKRIIVPDPDRAPSVKELFKKYSTGNHSILDLQIWLNALGFRTRNDKPISHGALGRLLAYPFYCGIMRWGGEERQGLHEPLIDKRTFERCQYVAAKHRNFLIRERKHNFMLRGFIFCKTCGMRHTAEWHVKDKAGNKIAYYHCNRTTGCRQPYIEMNNLEMQVEELFKDFQFSDQFIGLVVEKVRKALEVSRGSVEGEKRRLLNQKQPLEAKRNKLEDILLDGTIDRETFKRKHAEIQAELETLQRQIEEFDRKRSIDINLIEEVLALTRNIYKTYKEASPQLKRHYLRFFFEKIFVENKAIVDVKPSPIFAALREEQALILSKKWLPGLDSNQRPSA